MSDDLGFDLPASAHRSRWSVAVIVAALAGGAFVIGYWRHESARGDVAPGEAKKLHVEVVKGAVLAGDRALELPGTVRALEETKVWPRVTGYVRAWHADIGDKVTAGQLLAEIDTPETAAQLAQARAQAAQAQATVRQAIAQRDLSRANAARFEKLRADNLVSQAQIEQAQAQAQNDEANLAAAQSNAVAQDANVKRLVELQGFAKVVAPFAGTITQRAVDRGALVGDARGSALYTLVATDPVRVFVDIPQAVAPSVRAGTKATVAVREYPGRAFDGEVARSAGALDPELHTMMTEVRVPNPEGTLLPGMFVQVKLTLPVPHKAIEIPATALYSDAQGLRVAIVDAASKVHLVPITIERDAGATLLIATGLTGDERILKLAIPGLAEGTSVEVSEAR
jgi:membrane fusion protein, multidrug efflux system